MTFDAATCTAELQRIDIITRSLIRHAAASGNVTILEQIKITTSKIESSVRGEMRKLKKPTNWQLVCLHCNFSWPPNYSTKNRCPDCGEGMAVRTLDK